jgi:multidrug efflux pump subunit AcrB
MAEAGADTGGLSNRIKGELEKFTDLPIEFMVLSDKGAEEIAAYQSVLSAAVQGAAAVALMTALLTRGKSILAVVTSLTVPFICIVSAALLSIFGFPLDKTLLAGLSVGLGAAVDAAILSAECLGNRTVSVGRRSLKKLVPCIVSGSLTTIAALIPLTKMSANKGITVLAAAIGVVNFVSLAAALTLLPPLLLNCKLSIGVGKSNIEPSNNNYLLPILRRFYRLLAFSTRLSVNKPFIPIAGAVLVSVAAVIGIAIAGADVAENATGSVYAQIEFESGCLAEEGDILLARYAENLMVHNSGITRVQTSARTGSGSVLAAFDSQKIKFEAVRDAVRKEPIAGGFVYLPETSGKERIWKITIAGDEDEKCRSIAQEAARVCANLPIVSETALNFKNGSKKIMFSPDRERFSAAGLSFSSAGDTLRRGVHGPVAYKRMGGDGGGETDVRVRIGGASPSKEAVENLVISGGIRASSLMSTSENTETASLHREDRRQIASFSIRTSPMDPRTIRDKVMTALKDLRLPTGYSISFDREAIRAADELSKSAVFFVLALLFCYMVIASSNESFVVPLLVLSVVPPSIAVSVLCTIVTGNPINFNLAAAFIAVIGMAINASILTMSELTKDESTSINDSRITTRNIYRSLRRRLPVLLATTGTTIAGALPFLFLQEGSNNMVRDLSFVSAVGVGASCVWSVLLLPALKKAVGK